MGMTVLLKLPFLLVYSQTYILVCMCAHVRLHVLSLQQSVFVLFALLK